MSGIRLLALIPLAAWSLAAQTAANGTIQATGNVTISVNPDQAQLTVGVQTQAASAQAAADANAARTSAVIDAMKALLGSAGTLQTVSYSVYPDYNSTGQAITGYTVSNTLQATMSDLSLPGRLIDAANQAGAHQHRRLVVRPPGPGPGEAASPDASGQAGAGSRRRHRGRIERRGRRADLRAGGGPARPYLVGVAAAGAATPVITGTVSVSATVTISVQRTGAMTEAIATLGGGLLCVWKRCTTSCAELSLGGVRIHGRRQ